MLYIYIFKITAVNMHESATFTMIPVGLKVFLTYMPSHICRHKCVRHLCQNKCLLGQNFECSFDFPSQNKVYE